MTGVPDRGEGRKPLGLDAFCGGGGATRGYQLAGAEMWGCDIAPQPRYVGERFFQADALELLADLDFMAQFSFVHSSPPCQAHTTMSNRWRGAGGKADGHENLIVATRELLEATGLPYVIENVPGARAELRDPVTISGASVGLSNLDRPRLFETNWTLMVPPRVPAQEPIGVYGKAHDGRLLFRRKDGSEQHAASSLEQAGAAMGIDWMEWRELAEAIPPAYCELIGAQLLHHLHMEAQVA